jgi:hypothetical protein
MSGVSAAGNVNSTLANTMANDMANNVANNMTNNMANNFQTSQNSGALPGAGSVPNPVGMTAHALLETLLAQVIAHTMNGNAPNAAGATAGLPPSTPTTPTPTLPYNSNVTGK